MASKQFDLRCLDKLAVFLGVRLFTGETVSVQRTFREQSERVGHETKLVLGNGQSAVSFLSHGLREKTEFAQAGVLWITHDNVVKHFDFQKLPRTD